MKTHYRTVFLSDLHLGSRGCQAQELSRFLKKIRCDRLYLVGDVIDGWRLKSKWYWPSEHNDVLRRILKHAKKSEVILVPGNHDEFARQFHGHEFGGVKVVPYAVHVTAEEKKLLVVHGDQFDLVVSHHPVLSSLGGLAYDWLIVLNRHVNQVRRLFGLPYYSMSKKIKGRVKQACTFISRFEETLLKEAKKRDLDGVVCGHIHQAEMRQEEDGLYLNCGDWVESCTALVEHTDGRIELIDGLVWLEENKLAQELDDAEDQQSQQDQDEVEDDEQEGELPPRWVAAKQAAGKAAFDLSRDLSKVQAKRQAKNIKKNKVAAAIPFVSNLGDLENGIDQSLVMR